MEHNPWARAQKQLQKTSALVSLPPLLLARLMNPDRIVTVSLPIELDNGDVRTYTGFRVQHNNILGPYKGGLRYHQNVSMDEVKALSFWMSMKSAVIDIPMGGGKGGITVNPKNLSEGELERLTNVFAQRLTPVIGPTIDVPAPDVNTNGKIMKWILKEYTKEIKQKNSFIGNSELLAVVTGKPVEEGGSLGRTEATGLGGVYTLMAALHTMGKSPKGLTVAVQGFGNVGFYIAKFLKEQGLTVVAVSDSKEGVYVKDGLDPEQTLACKQEKGFLSGCYCRGSVCDLGYGKQITNEELLELDVDILIPAALENVITEENAGKIKAKLILEMANGPITEDADLVLKERSIPLIPDILANSGGVCVSYFEWYQNMHNEHWTKEEVFVKLKEKIEKSVAELFVTQKEMGGTLRDSAYVMALKRIEKKWRATA